MPWLDREMRVTHFCIDTYNKCTLRLEVRRTL